MSPMDYELVVIGAGSAGYNGASLAKNLGLRVALVDGAEELGGLCILRGCMPSKALIAGANRFYQARHSQEFGISGEPTEIDLPRLLARKDHHIAAFATDRREQIESGNIPFIHGNAVFRDSQTIEMVSGSDAGRLITANCFLLATGSHLQPAVLPGLADAGFEYSDTILTNSVLPKSVIILGGGAIGLEFAQYYNALGSNVTILQRSPRLLRGSDFEAADCLRSALEKKGIVIHSDLSLQSAAKTLHGKTVTYTQTGKEHTVEADEIFYALGRCPNLKQLGLSAAGVEPESVRLTQQTNLDHIFIAGDASGPYEVVHLAIYQAEVAVRNVVRVLKGNPDLEEVDYRSKLFVLFTHPELAQVGLTEEEAREAGYEFLTASHPFDDHGKSLVMSETDGFVKIVALCTTGEILGAICLGPEASSLIHEIAALMHFHGTVDDLLRIPHYHPTLSEIWTYPAEEIAKKIEEKEAVLGHSGGLNGAGGTDAVGTISS